MNAGFIIGIGFIYLLGVLLTFKTISYQCVMGMTGCWDYSFKNLLFSLFWPIGLFYMMIRPSFVQEESFEQFKKRRIKEYANMRLPK